MLRGARRRARAGPVRAERRRAAARARDQIDGDADGREQQGANLCTPPRRPCRFARTRAAALAPRAPRTRTLARSPPPRLRRRPQNWDIEPEEHDPEFLQTGESMMTGQGEMQELQCTCDKMKCNCQKKCECVVPTTS